MKFYISILIISLIFSSPPPKPEPTYEVFVQTSKPVQNINNTSLKDLEETSPSKYVEETTVVVNILENGKYEDHELKLATKNLQEGSSYPGYGFSINLADGQTFELISNSCYKTLLSGVNSTQNSECTSSIDQEAKKISFSYKFKLFKDEYIIINYKYKIIKTSKEILYKQEAVSIPQMYSGGICNYKFILPDGYINLGLKNNLFIKESEKIFSYINDCPSNSINEVIRFSPAESLWKADIGLSLEFSAPITGEALFSFPRYYIGGKNTNDNYKLVSNDNKPLEPTIENEILFNAKIPGNNTKIFGINLYTDFSNKLSKEFSVYTNEDFYKINENIDDVIRQKAQEIINDQSSEYKDYPNYYKIGKFVNSYIEYDLKYHGKNLTALEIYNLKKGVCEHYTILYNAMLNSIGIKTIKVFGWAFQKDETSANENTIGHAWTIALIDGKWKELDSTWGLFEGIPAGHILKGFNKEIRSYSINTKEALGEVTRNFIKKESIQLIGKFENVNFYESNGNNGEPIENEKNEVYNMKLCLLMYIIPIICLLL